MYLQQAQPVKIIRRRCNRRRTHLKKNTIIVRLNLDECTDGGTFDNFLTL